MYQNTYTVYFLACQVPTALRGQLHAVTQFLINSWSSYQPHRLHFVEWDAYAAGATRNYPRRNLAPSNGQLMIKTNDGVKIALQTTSRAFHCQKHKIMKMRLLVPPRKLHHNLLWGEHQLTTSMRNARGENSRRSPMILPAGYVWRRRIYLPHLDLSSEIVVVVGTIRGGRITIAWNSKFNFVVHWEW